MKRGDWNGHRIPLLAHCFNLSKGLGVDIHVRAANEGEAMQAVSRKLEHNRAFLRRTEGHYAVRFDREVEGYEAI